MKLTKQYTFDEQGRPVVSHVEIGHTGLNPQQNFSHRLIERAIEEGWIQIASSQLTMRATPEDLVYDLVRAPGYYCKSTGAKIPTSEVAWEVFKAIGRGDRSRKEAVAWLQANSLSGDDYEVTHAYECVLNDAQHEKFKAVRSISGNLVAAYTQGNSSHV